MRNSLQSAGQDGGPEPAPSLPLIAILVGQSERPERQPRRQCLRGSPVGTKMNEDLASMGNHLADGRGADSA